MSREALGERFGTDPMNEQMGFGSQEEAMSTRDNQILEYMRSGISLGNLIARLARERKQGRLSLIDEVVSRTPEDLFQKKLQDS